MLRIAPKEEIFRIGGDEFVILLRDISREALSRKVTELKNTNISASIGSVWDCGDVNVKELIARADRQMYSEKQKYYNQI